MKVNVFFYASETGGRDTINESNSVLPENIEKGILSELQKLINPEVLAGVQSRIDAMSDHTNKMLFQATLNRMARLDDATSKVHSDTQKRIHYLMDVVTA